MRKNQPRQQSYNNIFIMGMPGSGKSTFARAYAYFAGKKFLDFDTFFEKSVNMSIPKVFQTQGLNGFRLLESKVLHTLADKKNYVIALGGGTLLSPENYQFAYTQGLIAVLYGLSVEELAERIWNDKINTKVRVRPLFSKCTNIEQVTNKLIELEKERSATYEKADVVLNQKFNSTDNLFFILNQAEQNFDIDNRNIWKKS